MYFLKVSLFTSTSTSLLLMMLAVSNSINALAIPGTTGLGARDVWVPKIITPNATTVWKANSHGEVTWNTSNPPKQITNRKGTILLGHIDPNNPASGLNLDIKHPLASYVDLSLGKATIQVPANVTAGKYIVVLMGDSGNRSPEFTIEAAIAGADACSSPSATSNSSAEFSSAGNALTVATSTDASNGSSPVSSSLVSQSTPSATPSTGGVPAAGALTNDGSSGSSDPPSPAS
ncbi:hypothetical protein D9757_008476 [Collybiopsis confluens]|uniref:Uncharacterized protein n=1 Tax=Collybiopsis confluens TaxID=2823264 RepID=A0A8H5HFE0_9AGAR|nr:hypothetical protein D9757_008476 [Collybiopsis confluens]